MKIVNVTKNIKLKEQEFFRDKTRRSLVRLADLVKCNKLTQSLKFATLFINALKLIFNYKINLRYY